MIEVDFKDRKHCLELMDEYGDTKMPFFGENTEGESVIIGITHDSIAVDTFQKNGWCRRNVLWRDGTTEELYSK